MKIRYKGKTFDVVKVDGTYNSYYLTVQLDQANEAAFMSALESKTRSNEHTFKERYGGMIGLIPVDVCNQGKMLERFRMDMWMPDENKEEYEKSKAMQ